MHKSNVQIEEIVPLFFFLVILGYFFAGLFLGGSFRIARPSLPFVLLSLVFVWPAYLSFVGFLYFACPPDPFEYGCQYGSEAFLAAAIVELAYLFVLSYLIVRLFHRLKK
jgi:hypothetical protein